MEGNTIKDLEINERIRDASVRVIDVNGEQLGIMASVEANRLAESKGYDLVKVSPAANPPVCKIMDYGKYRFDMIKKEKDAKRNQKITEQKEVRLSATIDTHDLETKAKQAYKFLSAGDKVKARIRLRGRQQAHAHFGFEVMENFFELVKEVGSKDAKGIIKEGRDITMNLSPIKPKNTTK